LDGKPGAKADVAQTVKDLLAQPKAWEGLLSRSGFNTHLPYPSHQLIKSFVTFFFFVCLAIRATQQQS
jgi:hypothetical protein